jgi:hypothetical protein
MAYKSVQHSNRVFRDPGNITILANLTVEIAASGSVPTISLDNASDYSQSGYVTIGAETFYYNSKTAEMLTGVTRAVKGTSPGLHMIGADVLQSRPAPYGPTLTTSNLAGWYIDGNTNQASLRVYDSPVIQPGVIRFNADLGVFQGCIATVPSIIWQEFNATEGPPGEPGIINAILTFENVDDPTTLTSNIGEIIKTTTINTLDDPVPPVEVRTIVSGNVSINGQITDVLAITQTENEIVCTPQPTPLTWNMTDTIPELKDWDTVNQQAYTWATTARFPVKAGYIPVAGQVVVSYVSSPENQLCVKPLSFTNATSNLSPLRLSAPFPPDLGIVGICINNPSVDTPAVVATTGIAQVKLSNSATPYMLVNANYNVPPYTGKICIANGAGFGLNITTAITPPYVQIGTFLETGDMTSSGNAIVRLDPRIIT